MQARLAFAGSVLAIANRSAFPAAGAKALAPSQADRVTFGSKPDKTLAELEKRIEMIAEEQLKPNMAASAKQGVLQMLEDLSPQMRQALLEKGWGTRLCPNFLDAFRTEEDLLKWFGRLSNGLSNGEEKVQQHLVELRQDPLLTEKFGRMINRFKNQHPQHPVVEALSTRNGAALSDNDLKIYTLLSLLADKQSQDPHFAPALKQIVFPLENAFAKKLYKKAGNNSIAWFESIIRHETSHFIDETFGQDGSKQLISNSKAFQECVLKDKARAEALKIWPTFNQKIADGPLKNEGLLRHYFSPELSMDANTTRPEDKQRREKAFKEAFAETLSALRGGGAVNPKRVLDIYPSAAQWIETEVLNRYGMTRTTEVSPLYESPKNNFLAWIFRH